jgi:hypothetical protein
MKGPPATPPPNRPIAWCRSDDYQQSLKSLELVVCWTEPHCGLDMPLYAAPICDWANIAGKVDTAERLLINSIDDTSIDTGSVLRSLIEDIRNELGLPRPSEVPQ